MRFFKHTIPVSAALVAGVLFCTSVISVEANGFRNPPPGAQGLAMDGGKIAFLDDATAVSENAANIADAEKRSVMAAFTFIYPVAEFSSPLGNAKVDDEIKMLPNLYGVWPLSDKNLVFGLGVTTPFGQSTEWDKSAPFRYSAPYSSELEMIDITPVAAARFGPVAVGGGLDIYYSELTTKTMYPWAMAAGAPGLPDGEAVLDGDGSALGAHLGVTWNMTERQRLAATYRSEFSVDYEGDFRLTNIPAPAAGMVPGRTDFKTTIDFPNWVTVGYGIELNEKVRLGVDVEWIEFSSYDSLNLDLGAAAGSGLYPETLPQNWEDIWTYGVGLEWSFDDNSKLWATYKFLETPIPDATFSPMIVDADKHALGIGMGHHMGDHYVTYAYQINILDDREISSQADPALNGSYEATSHIFSLNYAYLF